MQAVKGKADSATASAKSGLEKADATFQEKKEITSQKREERMLRLQRELDDAEARLHDALAKQTGGNGGIRAVGTDASTRSGWIPTYRTAGLRNGARSFHL
ncbi:hypothetical protein V6N13_025115 [Hibiscus sabdariffa]|uniref:Uncharacterized protein n=1 Tax=Hibiscus sabdariffa TaxID=183260 RepID=A0ABR2AU91_9ROSI